MSSLLSFLLGYLLNALWQVPLVIGAAWFAARMVRGRSPATEHRIWVAALMLSVALPACDFRITDVAVEVWRGFSQFFTSGEPVGKVTVTMGQAAAASTYKAHVPANVLIGIAVAYALTMLAFAGRLIWGATKTIRLRRRAVELTLHGEPAESWQRCAQIFRVTDAEIATSPEIFGPVTIGIARRVLLLPSDWTPNELNPKDLNAAFAHEFAHMWRRDFAKNLAYEVLTLPVAWHPAMWMLRARLAESREMLCDALAAEALDGRESYARSLLRLASTLAHGTPARTLHAIEIFDTNLFERRVMQLTERSMEMRGVRRVVTIAGCFALASGVCASALALRIDGPRVSDSTPASPTGKLQEASPVKSPATAETFTLHYTPAPAPGTFTVHLKAPPAATIQAAQEPATFTIHTVPESQPMTLQLAQDDVAAQVPAKVMAGNLAWSKIPVYPPIAKVSKTSGAVVLHAIIGKDGSIKQLQALSGPEMLKGAAIEAVKDWKYKPYLLNGNPVEVDTSITVTFSLQD